MEKVFIVRITQVYECDELINDAKGFSTKEKAINYAKEFIEDEKECLLVELENESWIENDDLDSNWEWEVYEDGRYCENHTNLSIFELDVE